MKRNWYAAIILLALCVLLFQAGQYVDRTTAGMQRQLEAAYALAEQGDYPAARRAYSRAANRALRSTQVLGLLVRRNILDQLNQTLAVCRPVPRPTAWQTSRWRRSAPAPRSNRCGNHFSADFERLSSISFSSSIKVLTSLN